MSSVYTAQDTILFTDHKGEFTVTDLATGNVAEITAPNEMATVSTGFNGNSLLAHNEPGRQRQLVLRVVKGSGDDKRLNSWLLGWQNRSLLWKPANATLTKNLVNEQGKSFEDTYELMSGAPTGAPVTTVNTEGDIEQVVSVYTILFANNNRNV